MTGQVQPQSKHFRDFMPVLVTCKFDEDWVHSNIEKMETPFSHSKSMGRSKTDNSVMNSPTRPKFELVQHLMFVLVTCKFYKGSIKHE